MTALARGIEMQKRKPGQPHKGWKAAARKVHDRQSHDLPINAIVTSVVVDDPYEQGGRVEASVSLRDDVLRHLLVRGEIDQAQFEAGRKYERYAEQSQIGSVKAMDPTKEPVDGGGGFTEPVTDRQIAAVRELAEADRVLGRRPAAIVRAILVDRKKYREVAESGREGDIAHVRMTFKEGLEELAVFWDFSVKKVSEAELRASGRIK